MSSCDPVATAPGTDSIANLHLRNLWKVDSGDLKQKISLRHGQNFCRLASQQFSVSAHFISLRIDFDIRCRVVVNQIRLADVAAVRDCDYSLFESELFW